MSFTFYAKTIDGTTLEIDMNSNDTVRDLKIVAARMIGEKSVQASVMTILFGTRECYDHETLRECDIRQSSEVNIIVTRGCEFQCVLPENQKIRNNNKVFLVVRVRNRKCRAGDIKRALSYVED